MNAVDNQYLDLLRDIVDNGHDEGDSRTGVGTRAVFGRQLRFSMKEGFPLLTTKKMFTKGIIHEVLWFLGNHLNDPRYKDLGRSNAKYLIDNGINIWTGDLYKHYLNTTKTAATHPLTKEQFTEFIKNGDMFALLHAECGAIYGKQWTEWEREDGTKVNQIEQAISKLLNNPTDRRIMVSAWNVGDFNYKFMVLPPCHYSFTLFTRLLTLQERIDLAAKDPHFDVFDFGIGPESDGDVHMHRVCDRYDVPRRALSLKWNQRSVDTPLGLPFNIASYAILLHMFAKEAHMVPEDLVASLENTHYYHNQIDGIMEQLSRRVINELPQIVLNPNKTIFKYTYEDIKIVGYTSQEKIDFPLSN